VLDVGEGFATIGTVIALGYLLGHLGVLDLSAQLTLTRLSFYVASPALLTTMLQDADVAEVFSTGLLASAGAIALTGLCYLVGSRLLWPKDAGETVIGLLSSVYVNAGNLGLPIATYVLGNASWVVPVMLMQVLLIQPAAMTVLGQVTSGRPFAPRQVVAVVLGNPITVASFVGLTLALTGARLPDAVDEPLSLVGAMAVPAMLLAYGVSLRLGPRVGAGAARGEIAFIAALKLLVQPLTGAVLSRWLFGLQGTALLAVTVMAALPTGQNVFVHATTFRRGIVVARDTILVTTVLSVPVLLAVAALLA
jgi:malonate transporter and related proteins